MTRDTNGLEAGWGSRPTPAADSGPTQASIAAAYTRFVLILSVVTTVLIMTPILVNAFTNTHGKFPPALVAWIAVVMAAVLIVTIVRARRLKAQLQQLKARGESARSPIGGNTIR